MALWLTRAGKRGQFEQKFLDEGRIYLTWDGFNRDLSAVATRAELRDWFREVYASATRGRVVQNTNQMWQFAKSMQPGDWVVLPSKMKPAIHVGEITGGYTYDRSAENPFFHHRTVRWIETDVPRTNFDQDVLYSIGAFSTICQIKRNNAEERVRAMAANGWSSPAVGKMKPEPPEGEAEVEEDADVDLERLGRDNIAKLIMSRFKGHALESLVEAVLIAQGYTTYHSPEGPDKGIDILAAPGPLGFGQPRIAVQVKSGDSPVDRQTMDQLIGAMQNVHADQGLLVSWGGFKSSVDRETGTQFFRVRFWDQDTLVEQILANYDKLSDDLRAELPLKRIWTVAEEADAATGED